MAAVVLPILWTIFIAFRDLRLRDIREVGIFGAGWTLENFIGVFTSRGFFDALLTTLDLQRRRYRARHRSGAGGGPHRAGAVPWPDPRARLDAPAVRVPRGGGRVRLDGHARPEPGDRQRVRRGRARLGAGDPLPQRALERRDDLRRLARHPDGAAQRHRLPGVALLPVRVPLHPRPSPGGAGRPRRGRQGGRRIAAAALPLHPASRSSPG